MRTFLEEQFAPITSAFGFFNLPLDDVAAGLERWRRGLYDNVYVSCPVDGFPAVLHRVEPLMQAAPARELLVGTRSGWTAYFTSGLRGADEAAIGHLTQNLLCNGVAIICEPHAGRRWGAISFQMYGPLQTHFLNYVRNVSAINDGGRWVWNLAGTEQWFEETAAYTARRVRDRFTSQMLERYCQALGVDVFDPAFYGPEAVLIQSGISTPLNPIIKTLAETQRWLGIEPGAAEALPG